MFITAADIGKFLSEIVIRSYGKLLELIEWIGSSIDTIRDYLRDEDNDSTDSRYSYNSSFYKYHYNYDNF
ncbi:unnamed protein product [Thelazia callipaeda]|uniref:Variable surface protein n=1 Tax=Thelazia callipaeda TaxID=103827 RepID=A0A0N5DB90_THECL|nr:unnamed protein product [Thelazia callipaeda]